MRELNQGCPPHPARRPRDSALGTPSVFGLVSPASGLNPLHDEVLYSCHFFKSFQRKVYFNNPLKQRFYFWTFKMSKFSNNFCY